MRRRSIVLALTCLACTGPGPSTEGESSDTDSETETETESSETGEPGSLLLDEPTVVYHPKQPMIVDLVVELDAPGTAELTHDGDPGVGVVLLEPASGEPATTLRFRVRGLQPAAAHPLSLTVQEAQGDRSDTWSGTVTTSDPLSGYIGQFEVTTDDPGLVSGDMRLLDVAALFTAEPAGLILLDNQGTTRWYLGDSDGNTTLDDVWFGVQLRPDGTVSYTRRNYVHVMDELGELQLELSAESMAIAAGFHHDLAALPNGNFIAISHSFADVEYEGEGTLHVAGDKLYEFTPAGEIVWTWDSFDHLDPQRRRDGFYVPQKIKNPDTGQDGYDWTHANGVVYRAQDDTVLLSMRHQDWVIAIDHPSGEILWRLGDEGDFSLVGDQYWFFHQHSPEWQPDGSLILYDNAVGNPELPNAEVHSRAVRYALDFDAMTATMAWADDDPKFVSALAGDADRTSNGHVLRLDSSMADADNGLFVSRVHELDPERTPNRIWALTLPPGVLSYRAVPLTRWVGEPEN
ncbi:MAG TPA: aryl-sulfate sulfotransferase [Enhygromyxa sp.]|nr:aryl-sulfate sulfotransferase [Enhygromyxa sp.]